MTQEQSTLEIKQLKEEAEECKKHLLQCKLMADRFRTVAEYANDWIYWISPEGSYFYMSPSCERITGYRHSDFMANPELMNSIIHPQDRSLISLSIPSELGKGHLKGVDFRIITKNGEERWLNHVCQPIHTADGQFQGSRGSNRDITDRKAAEKEIASILETTNEGFIQLDNQLRITKVNPALCRMLDMAEATLIGHPWSEFLDEKNEAELLRQISELNNGKTGAYEMAITRSDNSIIFCLFNMTPLYDPKGERSGFFAMVSNLTGFKHLELELRHAKSQAESSNRAKSLFLANMTHEIRSPLNSIVGFSQILLKQGRALNLPDKLLHYLETIRTSGENLCELINNILDLSKIEAGKITLSEEDINLKLLLQGIFHANQSFACAKGVKFTYDFDPRLPDVIRSDRTRLHQILMNLVGNAIKFTPGGKAVVVKSTLDRELIVFEVADQGIGIESTKQRQIFEAFEQVDESMSRLYGGTGLGLAIVKKATELLKGQLQLRSRLGEGSVFTVKIPFRAARSITEEAIRIAWDDLRFATENRVLVIEDDPASLEMVEVLFREIGITIEKAMDGKSGIQKAETLKPDLILVDMHMPGMDGMAVTRGIRALPGGETVPIIALSADAFYEQQQAAFAAGVTAYLTKPLDFKTLVPILTTYLKMDRSESTGAHGAIAVRLPEAIDHQIREKLQKLSAIPPYDAKAIIHQVQNMLALCKPYESPYIDLLSGILRASRSRQSQTIPSLINEMLHANNSDR